jgi:hypothetical protein
MGLYYKKWSGLFNLLLASYAAVSLWASYAVVRTVSFAAHTRTHTHTRTHAHTHTRAHTHTHTKGNIMSCGVI